MSPVTRSPTKEQSEALQMAPDGNVNGNQNNTIVNSENNRTGDNNEQAGNSNNQTLMTNNIQPMIDRNQSNNLTEINEVLKMIKDTFVNIQKNQIDNNNRNEDNSRRRNNKIKIDIPIPQFYDEYRNNPVEFIIDLKQYLEIKDIPQECELLIIKTAMKGRARAWFLANMCNWNGFEHFEADFYSEFFSIEFRTEMTNAWRDRRFCKKDGTFVNFFHEQTRQACYLEPPMSDYARNFSIVRQLPKRVQDAMASVDLLDKKRIIKTLAWLDGTEMGQEKYVNRNREIRWNREREVDESDVVERREYRNHEEKNRSDEYKHTVKREGFYERGDKNDRNGEGRAGNSQENRYNNWRKRDNNMQERNVSSGNWRKDDNNTNRNQNDTRDKIKDKFTDSKYGNSNERRYKVATMERDDSVDDENNAENTNSEIEEILDRYDLN